METIKRSATYNFIRSDLREDPYVNGDVYTLEKVNEQREKWKVLTPDPYLKHVKNLSRQTTKWPHLGVLADFMEVGTAPARWKDPSKAVTNKELEELTYFQQRPHKVNVVRLDYSESSDKVESREYKDRQQLTDALQEDDDSVQLRLYVVEDLSRDVIEALGYNLDIEPAFFAEQTMDFAWYNIRDRWQEPPNLRVMSRKQRWIQLRWARARYFQTTDSFQLGIKEADGFNVSRRPDDDLNNKSRWDNDRAIVGITRTRASFWLRKADKEKKKGAIGVLLLDPTIKEGKPLWYGYRDLESTPSVRPEKCPPTPQHPEQPKRDSLFDDLVYWAKRPAVFASLCNNTPVQNIHVPMQALLYLICSDWFTMSDYIKTRLVQIEWEISFPEHFLNKNIGIDVALRKLHMWRRLVPLYREMLEESLQRVFHFPCQIDGIVSNITSSNLNRPKNSEGSNTRPNQPQPCDCAFHRPENPNEDSINVFHDDFAYALSRMEEYQRRIDRLTSVVTAIISIDDSRRGQADNRNVARLTWLATFFIPLSYMSSLFSMQSDVSSLTQTYKLYFETALPLAALSLGLAFILTLPEVQKFVQHAVSKMLSLWKREPKTREKPPEKQIWGQWIKEKLLKKEQIVQNRKKKSASNGGIKGGSLV